MKLLGLSIDYLDIILTRERKHSYRDEVAETTYFGEDVLPLFFRTETGISFEKKYSNSKFALFNTADESMFMQVKDLQTSIQLKGIFFLKENWQEEIKKIIGLIDRRGWQWHISRVDLALTLETDLLIEKFAKKFEFKKLLVRTYQRSKKVNYVKAGNSNFDFVVYQKNEHLKSIKDPTYKDLFRAKYGDSENVLRVDLRLKNKRTNIHITNAIKSFDFKEVENLIFKETNKRLKISSSVKKLFLPQI